MVDAVNSITSAQTERQKVFDYVRTLLGDGMIDVELDPADKLHIESLTGDMSSSIQ